MVLVGPSVQRRTAPPTRGDGARALRGILLTAGAFVLGIYGGYFGAAQGILLVGLMGMVLSDGIQRLNAIKNVLATAVNAVAALTFMAVATDRIDWEVVALIRVGRVHRRLSRRSVRPTAFAAVLRVFIVVIGLVALVKIVVFD